MHHIQELKMAESKHHVEEIIVISQNSEVRMNKYKPQAKWQKLSIAIQVLPKMVIAQCQFLVCHTAHL